MARVNGEGWEQERKSGMDAGSSRKLNDVNGDVKVEKCPCAALVCRCEELSAFRLFSSCGAVVKVGAVLHVEDELQNMHTMSHS